MGLSYLLLSREPNGQKATQKYRNRNGKGIWKPQGCATRRPDLPNDVRLFKVEHRPVSERFTDHPEPRAKGGLFHLVRRRRGCVRLRKTPGREWHLGVRVW